MPSVSESKGWGVTRIVAFGVEFAHTYGIIFLLYSDIVILPAVNGVISTPVQRQSGCWSTVTSQLARLSLTVHAHFFWSHRSFVVIVAILLFVTSSDSLHASHTVLHGMLNRP